MLLTFGSFGVATPRVVEETALACKVVATANCTRCPTTAGPVSIAPPDVVGTLLKPVEATFAAGLGSKVPSLFVYQSKRDSVTMCPC
jgi:hypothetical protein